MTAPPGAATRPTSDKVKEAIFAILGPPDGDCRVLDLFAGTGALALESISRGAVHGTMVDAARPAILAIKANVAALGLENCTQVASADGLTFLGRPATTRWTWVFLDPPYKTDLALRALTILGDTTETKLTGNAKVVIEHDRHHAPAERVGTLLRTDQRRYGDTWVSFYAVSLSESPSLASSTPASEAPDEQTDRS